MEEIEADFQDLTAATLDNTGIDTENWLQTTKDLTNAAAVAPHNTNTAFAEANEDKIISKITFDLPNAGLGTHIVPNNLILPSVHDTIKIFTIGII
jgi:hypothetical protein